MTSDDYYPLQELILPDPSGSLPLYFFADHDEKKLPRFRIENGQLAISAGTIIHFNTLVNSFYEHTWKELATFSDITLELNFNGILKVDVFRGSRFPSTKPIASRTAHSIDGPLRLEIPSAGILAGRLFFTVTAPSGNITLLKGRWCTRTKPINAVALRIAICTFNKEQFLIPNLRKLTQIISNKPEVKEIVVVNQGDFDVNVHKDVPNLSEANRSKIRIIRQPNFGGSGGFTRGILEAMERKETTHVLLMDDDISFDSFIIDRLVTLLGYIQAGKVVGGQMLEHERRTRLYASDEKYDFIKLQPVNPLCGTDFSDPTSIQHFNVFRPAEYNGWWFCCFPVTAFESHDLPLPFFVRGDDIEFAYRLKSHAIVTVPGLFVWHETFHFKTSAMMEYFTARNWLILSIIHSPTSAMTLLSAFFKMFWWFIITCRYDLAHARLHALRDFLRGPEYVFSQPIGRHAGLISRLKKYELKRVQMRDCRQRASFNDVECPRSGRTKWIVDVLFPIWLLLFAPKIQPTNIDPNMEIITDDYNDSYFFYRKKTVGVLNELTGIVTIHAPACSVVRALCWDMLKELFRAHCASAKLFARYRKQYQNFATQNYWRKYLSLD